MPKGNTAAEDRAKVKFRFIEFELDGENAAVENSIRNLTTALTRSTSQNVSAKALPPRTQAALPPVEQVEVLDAEEVEPEETPDAENEVDTQLATPHARRAPRKPKTPELVPDLDPTVGNPSLKEFCDEKGINNDGTDTKKYLACALWLKDHKQIPSITDAHIYTCFKFMKWPLQADIGGPLRTMKKQDWFTSPERGKFSITHLGENQINGIT